MKKRGMNIRKSKRVHFWAKTTVDRKPGISVYEHMINVGCVAQCIAKSSPKLLDLFNLSAMESGALAALHDIGKISPGFQRKCEAWLNENCLIEIARNGCWDTNMESDHGKVSHSAIQSFLQELGIPRKSGKFLSAILGAHHGHLNRPEDRGYLPNKALEESQSEIEWAKERRDEAYRVWRYFQADYTRINLTDQSPAIWWLAGLTTIADWIASDERYFPYSFINPDECSLALAQKTLRTIGFQQPEVKPNLSFADLFPFPANDMQIKAMDTITEPGVYVIEAPMGLGKTEAALAVAYQLMVSGKANGIYFALPTQATSNRIHLRMNEFLQRIASGIGASRLIHGNSWLMDIEIPLMPSRTDSGKETIRDASAGRDWFTSAKRALIASFGVGTIDQALLGVVAAKHFFVRHFALAGKVVILDEVHTYDLYTGTLIDKLISTLEGLGCTVIVLSATLSGKRREEIIQSAGSTITNAAEHPYPLISGRRENQVIEPVKVTPPESRMVEVEFVKADAAVNKALQIARDGGTVLWICNTVDTAQNQFRELEAKAEDAFPLGLLHSRFPFWRREELEDEWMSRLDKSGKTRCGSILVSTQIVEQSVDLDADLMITELAPTDMLLQRLGRLWRHKRTNRPTSKARLCIIEESHNIEEFKGMEAREIEKSLGAKAFVYAPYVLLRTLQVWKKFSQISIPSQIRQLIEETYSERTDEPTSWRELLQKVADESYKYRQHALMNTNVWCMPDLPDEEGIQTRVNELPTVSVILCQQIASNEVVLANGTKIVLGGDAFQLSIAKGIHRNLAKVPRYCFDSVVPFGAFRDYLRGEQTVGIITTAGSVEVKGLKNSHLLHFSNKLGLSIDKISAKEEA